jgi:hypothetical protein
VLLSDQLVAFPSIVHPAGGKAPEKSSNRKACPDILRVIRRLQQKVINVFIYLVLIDRMAYIYDLNLYKGCPPKSDNEQTFVRTILRNTRGSYFS